MSLARSLIFSLTVTGTLISLPLRTPAQIQPDDTLGAESSQVIRDVEIRGVSSDRVEGGAIRGNHLFHSFSEFNIQQGRGAYFANPESITNIFTRVTGANPSQINGTLGVLGNANLFFLNPNGIIFGSGASLDLRGAFVATTGSNFLFPDGTTFGTINPQSAPLLSVEVTAPVGVEFASNPGRIINRSQAMNAEEQTVGLQVPFGKTLAFLGGEIQLEGGQITSQGGHVELGSVGDNSRVSWDENLGLGYENVTEFRNISLSRGSRIAADGERPSDVTLRGREIKIVDSQTQIDATNTGSELGANLTLDASESILIDSGGDDGVRIQAQGTGKAGQLLIETEKFTVQNGAFINASSFSDGRGADVIIRAKESVELLGQTSGGDFGSAIQAGAVAGGNSGNVTIFTERLVLRDGAVITASAFVGEGNAGSLTVRASESVEIAGTAGDGNRSGGLFTQSNENSTGDAGSLKVETGRLTVRDGAQLSVSTLSPGNGGEIIINASESVEILDGVFREDGSRVTSGFFSSVGRANDREINKNATGEGGDIIVNTGRLVVRNAQLTATTFAQGEGGSLIIDVEELSIQDGGQVGVGSIGEGVSGNGGELKVTASQLIEIFGTGLDFTLLGETERRPVNSRLFAQSEGTGDAGNIEVDLNSTGEMTVRDRATISVNAEGTGTAGDIIIEEVNHITLDQGEITATSFSGNGGNIDLTISDRLSLSNNSTISTTAGERQNAGDGGNININTSFLVAQDNSDITANAFEGDGGNITLSAEGIFGITPREENTSLSDITASSQLGQEGVINIETPETDPASTLTNLPEEEVNVEFARACARSPEQSLAFYNLGRGGLPPTPDRFLPTTEGVEWLALPTSESDDRADSVTTQPVSFFAQPLFSTCASQESTPPN